MQMLWSLQNSTLYQGTHCLHKLYFSMAKTLYIHAQISSKIHYSDQVEDRHLIGKTLKKKTKTIISHSKLEVIKHEK